MRSPRLPALKVALASARASCSAHPTGCAKSVITHYAMGARTTSKGGGGCGTLQKMHSLDKTFEQEDGSLSKTADRV